LDKKTKRNHEDQNDQDILEKDDQDEDDGLTFLKCPKILHKVKTKELIIVMVEELNKNKRNNNMDKGLKL
jgi:hypothetical protein